MQGQGQDSFRSVVMRFLKTLSQLTSTAEPFDYHIDMLWALLDRYTKDEDHDKWEDETHLPEDQSYEASMNKLRIISLVLYRSGVLPKKTISKRQFNVFVKARTVGIGGGGMSSHLKEDVGFTDILFNHMYLLSFLTKNRMDSTVHIDTLWFLLSPYITEEDFYRWKMNNQSFGNPDHKNYEPYMWNIEKIRIVVSVMDRADFLWKTTIVDAPEEYVDNKGEINVRSSVSRS
ncbi:hypothetical protein KAU43_01405 [candidate division WOR-3 bacterium]|nr:hypothetical protein [candidate division WOR-3 bacterium]